MASSDQLNVVQIDGLGVAVQEHEKSSRNMYYV